MNKLTKDDINTLKKVEEFFKQIREGYKRASSIKEDMIVAEIYERITGKKETNFACGKCVFNMYKTVGEHYYKALDSDTLSDDTTKNKPKTVKKTNTNGRKRTGVKAKKD